MEPDPLISDANGAAEPRSPGRPRCEHTCEAIREAALSLMEERGFVGLTVEEIAARAGASKATVYRWWTGKAALVVDAFFAKVSPHMGFTDTGSVRTDFIQQMRHVVRQMNSPNGRVLASLVAGAQIDEALAEAFRSRWLRLRRDEGMTAVRRGVERGELREGVDTEFLFDMLYSPLYFRLLVRHQPLTDAVVEQIVDAVLGGLAPRADGRGGKGWGGGTEGGGGESGQGSAAAL